MKIIIESKKLKLIIYLHYYEVFSILGFTLGVVITAYY